MRLPIRALAPVRTSIFVGGCAVFIFLLALLSPVSYAGSDSHFSLVASQAIAEQGTLRLDSYIPRIEAQIGNFPYEIARLNNHVYYQYPVGSPLFTAPFVWLANRFGADMTQVAQNYMLQNLLSALVCSLVFVVLYRIGLYHVSPLASAQIACISMLGSSLMSTMATALWSLDLTVLFLCISLWIMEKYEAGQNGRLAPYGLGLSLFAAYLCRPTAGILALLALFYLGAWHRRDLAIAASVILVCSAIFAAFNWREFGQPLPGYYVASNWLHGSQVGTAVYGALFSPARGLFVYSPFFFGVLAGALLLWRKVKRFHLAWLAIVWFCGHLAAVAATSMWWGGYSFGPRLLTDAIPALVILTCITWSILAGERRQWQKAAQAGYILLGAIGILINSGQGLFNINTVTWNAMPSIDRYPEYVFDWQYPQFLATADTFHERYLAHTLQHLEQGDLALEPYQFGEPMTWARNERSDIFAGWWTAAEDETWSETNRAHVLFRLVSVDQRLRYQMIVSAGSRRVQPVSFSLNGHDLGRMTFNADAETHSLTFDGQLMRANGVNQITLDIPNAAFPGIADLRQLGLRYIPHRLGLKNVQLVIMPDSTPAIQDPVPAQ